MNVREYAEQRRIDALNQREDADDDSYAAARCTAQAVAFQEIMDFVDGHYRPEYLEAVEDRIARRKAVSRRDR